MPRSPHDVLLLRFAPPNNAAGTPTLQKTTTFESSDNDVAPTQHHRTTTHDRRHP